MSKTCNECRFHEEYNDMDDEYCCCKNSEMLKGNNDYHINNCLSINSEDDCIECPYYEDFIETEINICGDKNKIKRLI